MLSDSLIPIQQAIAIYKKYRIDPNIDIEITDCESLTTTSSGVNITRELALTDNHYTIVTSRCKTNKCNDCGRVYWKQHKCNPQRINYHDVHIAKNGKRSLMTSNRIEHQNNQNLVIHYDLETFQNAGITIEATVHTPYIVGYTDLDSSEFEYLAGNDCMKSFVDFILRRGSEIDAEDAARGIAVKDRRKIYVNAYNGSGFDHYFIFQEFLRRGLKPDKHIVNNGAVISFKHGNLYLFDICKHLQGSLADNLKALKCDVQKGDFNHDNASRWEVMPEELRVDCLKYLRSDVLGLREIYNKVNANIFHEYKVNLTSYISTSSLTFNMWRLGAVKQYLIRLPNLQQEPNFREAIRGGRTYKTKHEFTSEQYEGFMNGQVAFNDIDDYMIDADVVSLYPTAMAKFEYQVGDDRSFLLLGLAPL